MLINTGRVVNVSSIAGERKKCPFEIHSMPYKTDAGWGRRYCQEKMAQVLHAWELNRRESCNGVTAYALHPGVIRPVLFNWWQTPPPPPSPSPTF